MIESWLDIYANMNECVFPMGKLTKSLFLSQRKGTSTRHPLYRA